MNGISLLRLKNFRRHADTELRFDEGDQLIYVGGDNGVGKTSLIEAATFALYGESRKGRRGLDELVRRGAELEGMEVEIDITIGKHVYKAIRRRDSKNSSAVLYCDGEGITQGPNEVTAEITRLTGMDARAFKLAIYAPQKELDGLATMSIPDKRKIMSKLLGVNVVERARDEAGKLMRDERNLANRLTDDNSVELADNVKELKARLAEVEETHNETVEAANTLKEDFESSAWIDTALKTAQQRYDDAEKLVENASGELSYIAEQLDAIEMPVVVEGDVESVESLLSTINSLETRLAAIDENTKRAAQARQIKKEIESLQKEKTAAEKAAGNLEDLIFNQRTASSQLEKLISKIDTSQEELDVLRGDYNHNKGLQSKANEVLAKAESLEADCLACGQEVSEDHKHTQVASAEADVEALNSVLEDLKEAGTVKSDEVTSLQADKADKELELSEITAQVEVAKRAASSLGTLEDRIDTNQANLASIEPGTVENHSSLTEELGKAQLDLSVAKGIETYEQELSKVENEIKIRGEEQARAQKRLDTAKVSADEAQIDPKLSEKQAERETLKVEVAKAEEAASESGELLNTVKIELGSAEARLSSASEIVNKRKEAQKTAQVASVTKDVLEDVAKALHAQIKPTLEGVVSELLASMSNSRFDSVKIDDCWNVLVRDDGKHRPLADLSGGEADIVALAMRIGISQVVSQKHTSGGAGLIILDEPLGSLDEVRRSAVLESFRGLRGAPQVWVISHVGGVEDHADAVVTIERNDSDEELVSVADAA